MSKKNKYDQDELANNLYKIVEDCAKEMDALAKADYAYRYSNTKPGSLLPEYDGSIESETYRLKTQQLQSEMMGKANDLLDEAYNAAASDMVEPPTPDGAAYVASLTARAGVTQQELDAAFATYGDNWTLSQQLREYADKQNKEWASANPNADQKYVNVPNDTLDGNEEVISSLRREMHNILKWFCNQSYRVRSRIGGTSVKFDAGETKKNRDYRLETARESINSVVKHERVVRNGATSSSPFLAIVTGSRFGGYEL